MRSIFPLHPAEEHGLGAPVEKSPHEEDTLQADGQDEVDGEGDEHWFDLTLSCVAILYTAYAVEGHVVCTGDLSTACSSWGGSGYGSVIHT